MTDIGSPLPRRKFIATTAAAFAMAPNLFLRAQEGSPNDDITLAVIGCGAMGTANMTNFLNTRGARVIAVCDVDSEMLGVAKKSVDDFYKNSDCKTFARYQDVLALKGLDAIVLTTPDHWHARIGIEAAKAGLDIYGEKPFTWGLAEGRALVKTLQSTQRVWQTGSWQRSGGEFRRFKALIQNNTLGKLTRFECGTPSGMGIKQNLPEAEIPARIGKPPATLDWQTYCGPVKGFEYHPMLHPWNWRWHTSFGGGQLLDWVGHHVDIALWTLGLDHSGPIKVEGTGEKGTHPFFNTYVNYQYQGTFADGRVIEVRSNFSGTRFTGENGWIHVDRGKLEASDRELLRNLPADFNTKPPSHHMNFLECVRSRKLPVSDAEGSHRSASFGQLALAAIDSAQPLHWDPATETVLNNPDQAKHPRLGSRLDF